MTFLDMSPGDMVRVDHALSIVCAAGELLVLAFLVHSKTLKKLPFFTTYVAWTFLSDLILLYLQRTLDPKIYLNVFLVETCIDSLLQFSFLVELAWSVLAPVRKSLPRATLYILIALIALVGCAIWPLASLGTPKGLIRQEALIYHAQQTVAILRVICFLVMACFSQLLSIGWRNRELQVATGIGTFSIVSLIVSVLHTRPANFDMYHYLDWITSVSYLGSIAYWVSCFSTREQKRREFSPQMQQFLLQMGGGARSSRIALTNLPQKRFQDKD